MLFAIIKDSNNKIIADFMDYKKYYDLTFSPCSKVLHFIDFSKPTTGKTYLAKKEFIREQAKTYQEYYQYIDNLQAVNTIENYFEHWGKKYGLLKEFRENAII